MKVLLIATAPPDLPGVLDEVQDILNSGLDVHPLLGQSARHTDVLRQITLGRHDVLWLAGHLTPDGYPLSDGLLSASLLTSLARGRVCIVVMNTCSSFQMAQMIHEETRATVICTVADVPDREAYQTGALLARALADTGQIELAYERSKPGGNRTYLLLAAREVNMVSMHEENGLTRLGNEISKLTEMTYGLRREIAVLEQRIVQLERTISVIMWGMGIIGTAVLSLLYMVATRG